MWPATNYDALIVLGPTASGKTHLAVALAAKLGGEVVSADSRQVYRGLNIGAGKDYHEYNYNGVAVPYHMIDVADLTESYDIAKYRHDARRVIQTLQEKQKHVVVCGGSGLYIESLLKPMAYTVVPEDAALREVLLQKNKSELLDELASLPNADKADTTSMKRLVRAIEVGRFLQSKEHLGVDGVEDVIIRRPMIVGIDPGRELRRERISQRLTLRMQQGMVEEVEGLIAAGHTHARLQRLGLEYKYISMYLSGDLSRDEMMAQLETEIHRFAKRQMTWFRKMEKEGYVIHWLSMDYDGEEILKMYLE